MSSSFSVPDLRILLIDGDPNQEFLVRDMLDRFHGSSWSLHWESTWDGGWEKLRETTWDVCLLNHPLGTCTGLELLTRATEHRVTVPIIMLTGSGSFDVNVRAMHAGAVDYLMKDQITAAVLERSLRYAVKRARQREALDALARRLEAQKRQLEEFV